MADNPIYDENNVVLYDDLGHKIGSVLKNGIYRLEQRGVITSPDGTKDVTVSTDGAKERLDVSLGDENTFQLRAWIPVTTFDSTGVSLNTSTWTTLLTIPADEGKLDFIACVGGSSQYRIRLTVDGSEVFDLAMSDLSSMGLSNATNVPVWAETADKNFRYNPNTPVDFNTSVLVEAKAVTATPLLKYLITYREPA